MNKPEKTSEQNKLGTLPIGTLLVSMSLPMMVSFFIQALYNIVDSMFVARISENALTAVSLAMPMQMIMHAISVGIGVGINAVIPRCLGKGDRKQADRTAGTGIFLNLCFMAFFMILGIFASHSIYTFQTDVAEIVDLGTVYLSICWIVSLGEFTGQYFEKLLLCSGWPMMAMLSQAAGAIFNIIFDPILIFGLGPFPKMGIAGAAAATVLGQILAAVIGLGLNLRKNQQVHLSFSAMKPNAQAVKDIFAVGFPSMITIGLSSATSFVVNQILLTYSTTATAVYGIWLKLQNFSFMPVFGMNNGSIPILAYNLAKKSKERVNRTIRLALSSIVIYLTVLLIVLEFIPAQLLLLFNASEFMLSIGIRALRICMISLPLGGGCIILTTAMQALGHSRYALVINILRQFVIIVGLFVLISAISGKLGDLWLAVPITEGISLLIAAGLERRMQHNLWHGDTSQSARHSGIAQC